MLKFFRRIRQRLLIENKVNKYMLYAVGEIILVVIGILIALAINSWNQNRLNEKEERRILTSISEELELSRFLFDRGSDVQKKKLSAAKSLLEEIQDQKETSDNDLVLKNLDLLTKRWLSGTPTSIYDALIGSGDLRLISSDELRNRLAQLKSDQEFLRLFEEIQIKFEDEQLNPLLNKYINRSEVRLSGPSSNRISDIPLIPTKTSFNPMLKNQLFANILVEFIEHCSRVINNYERLYNGVDKINQLVTSKTQ